MQLFPKRAPVIQCKSKGVEYQKDGINGSPSKNPRSPYCGETRRSDMSEDMCYIGRKDCGCIVLAIVDNPEHKKDTAREVGKAIKDGLKIERVTDQFVRDNMKRCPHKNNP